MRNYLILTKTLIMCGLDLGSGSGKKRFSISRNMTAIISTVIIVALIVAVVNSFIILIRATIAAGGNGFLLVEQGMSVGMLVALIMGIPMVLSSFYISSDTTTLLSLPLSIPTIAAARFTRCLFYDYSLVMLFCLPAFIAFGIATSASALYWVFAILLFLFLPITPLVYDTVLAMVLMRVFRRFRNKKLLTGIGTAATLVFAIGWVFVGMRSGGSDTLGMATSLSTLGNTGFLFPNLIFANAAIEQLSFANLGLFILTSAVLVALFLVIAKLIYFDSVIGMSEMATRRQALSTDDVQAFGNTRKPLAAYIHTERLKMLHSSYVVQAFLSELIWPLILAGSIIFAAVNNGNSDIVAAATSLIGKQNSMLYLVVCTIGITYLCASTNTVPALAISLEGGTLEFLKTMPISFRDLVEGKIKSLLWPDYLLANILPLAVGVFCVVLGMNPLVLVIMLIVGIAGTVTVCYVQILFDLNKPLLNWSDQAALGRKLSTLFAVLAAFILGVIVFAICLLPTLLLGLGEIPSLAICVVVSVLLAVGSRAIALNYGEKRLRQLP